MSNGGINVQFNAGITKLLAPSKLLQSLLFFISHIMFVKIEKHNQNIHISHFSEKKVKNDLAAFKIAFLHEEQLT